MALLHHIYRIAFALILVLSLSHCEKEQFPLSTNPKPDPSPSPGTYKVNGRVEFASEHQEVLGLEIPSQVRRNAYSGRIIVKYKEGMKSSSFSSYSMAGLEVRDDVAIVSKENAYRTNFSIIKKKGELSFSEDEVDQVVEAFKAENDVEYAEPEYLRTWRSLEKPNDSNFDYQWGLNENFLNIRNDAWQDIFDEANGKEIRVAVVDTGYRPHDDLDGNIRKDLGYDFVSDPELEADNDSGIDSDPTDIDDNPDAAVFYHGTFVSGIIAAIKNNAKGVSGIAPNVKIIPIRVLGKGGFGGDLDIEQGIRYAAGLPNNSGRILGENEKAHVINLSLGGPVEAPGIHRAIVEAVSAGVPVVCAAGNEGTSSPTFPAAYDECISVGALKPTGEPFSSTTKPYKIASYSNWGINVDITAPGGSAEPFKESDGIPEGVVSTYWRSNPDCNVSPVKDTRKCSTYQPSAGTSFAAPHVAGVIALMRSLNSSLSPLGIASVLYRTAIDDNDREPFENYFGYGIVNAISAVKTAKSLTENSEDVLVRVLNPVSGAVLKSKTISGSSDYRFSIEGVPSGDYYFYLQAGTDYDNDGIICEKGEKFGTYPELQSKRVVRLNSMQEDLVIELHSVKSDEECK